MEGYVFTDTQKLDAIRREIKYREYVYPRRVNAEKMKQAQADRELAIMRAIAADYERLAQAERLL